MRISAISPSMNPYRKVSFKSNKVDNNPDYNRGYKRGLGLGAAYGLLIGGLFVGFWNAPIDRDFNDEDAYDVDIKHVP